MRKRLVIAALAVARLVVIAGSALAAESQSAVIFDNTAKTGPKSNLPSYGPEAYSATQIGGKATFAGSKRKLSSAVVTLSSWACVDGRLGRPTASRPQVPEYSLPITLNVYDPTDRGVPWRLRRRRSTSPIARPPIRRSAKVADQVVLDDREGVLQRSGSGRHVHLQPDQTGFPQRRSCPGSPTVRAILGPTQLVTTRTATRLRPVASTTR